MFIHFRGLFQNGKNRLPRPALLRCQRRRTTIPAFNSGINYFRGFNQECQHPAARPALLRCVIPDPPLPAFNSGINYSREINRTSQLTPEESEECGREARAWSRMSESEESGVNARAVLWTSVYPRCPSRTSRFLRLPCLKESVFPLLPALR